MTLELYERGVERLDADRCAPCANQLALDVAPGSIPGRLWGGAAATIEWS